MSRPSTSTNRHPIVLLVQQSRDDGLEMYAEFLRHRGLVSMTVSNARDAFQLAPQADIVVTGITLDGPIDGVELVARLRRDGGTRRKPIVVLTACAWARDWERAAHAGCDVFLAKPCLPNDLLREVRRLIAATRSQTVKLRTYLSLPHTARRVTSADRQTHIDGEAGDSRQRGHDPS